MTTQEQLNTLITSNPTNNFYQSLSEQLKSKGKLSEKQEQSIQTSFDKYQRVQEYISKCESIISQLSDNEAFNPTFVKNLLENFSKYKSVSDKQAACIDNVIEKWIK